MTNRRNRSLALVALALVAGLDWSIADAADPDPADPKGKWTFTLLFPEMGLGEFKLDCLLEVAKIEEGKATGKIGSAAGEGIVDILDGKWKDGELSFRVVDPQNITSRYKGKVADDKIKGKFEVDIPGGDTLELDWNATRVKEEKK